MENLLKRTRLLDILREYGEYPRKYRQIIWSSLMELPNNRNAFMVLIRRGMHPLVKSYNNFYPLKDRVLLRRLKTLMSCLMHWCNAFTSSKFMPAFVFPFLNIFPNSPLLAFELLITVLLNYCQLWFEFSPLQPLNYFGIIENILSHFAPNLIQFYKEKQVSANIYAWPLMSTAFSNVLDICQWSQLWDNIISNEPEFLLFCIVAYNVLQKSRIVSLETVDSIEHFFHYQNIPDVKKLVKFATEIMNRCPEAIHPKLYLYTFKNLPFGYYPNLENYPKRLTPLKMKVDALHGKNASHKRTLEELYAVE